MNGTGKSIIFMITIVTMRLFEERKDDWVVEEGLGMRRHLERMTGSLLYRCDKIDVNSNRFCSQHGASENIEFACTLSHFTFKPIGYSVLHRQVGEGPLMHPTNSVLSQEAGRPFDISFCEALNCDRRHSKHLFSAFDIDWRILTSRY